MSKRLLNRLEIAEYLGVSTRTVDRWIVDLNLPRKLIGRSVRFDLDAVRPWYNRITKQAEKARRN